MKVLIRKSDGVVVDLNETIFEVNDNVQVGYVQYADKTQYDIIEVTDSTGIYPSKSMYSNGVFVENPNYIKIQTPEERFNALEAQNAQMLLALVQGGLM